MHYNLTTIRKRKAQNNDDPLYRKNYVQSQKIIIEYERDTAAPENILLKLTIIMTIFLPFKRYSIGLLKS